jgi:L,D-transpeptidase-like protein/putative peptidoglycan binding protein
VTRHRRHARSRVRGSVRVAVSIGLGVVLLGGGAAFAAYRYDAATAERLMPGVTIAGIDVGEMSRAEAASAVSERVEAELGRQIEVRVRGQVWHVTPGQLGMTADVGSLVDRALALNQGYSWPERVFRRLFNRPIGHAADIRFRPDPGDIRAFVQEVAGSVSVEPLDASVDYEDGQLVLQRPRIGWSLPVPDAKRTLREAILGGAASVDLHLDRVEPEVTKEDLGYTIVVDLSELRLHLYSGLREVRTFPVAAGQPAYPTPMGEWHIVDKVENPSWINPDPEGWGASLPASIPPGPGNPLGTRALYLDAPGIRIHGTSASYSIGTYASHGCIRMYMDDVEQLFGIVPVGTTVHIVP